MELKTCKHGQKNLNEIYQYTSLIFSETLRSKVVYYYIRIRYFYELNARGFK